MKKNIVSLITCICLAGTTVSYAEDSAKQDSVQTAQLAIEEKKIASLKEGELIVIENINEMARSSQLLDEYSIAYAIDTDTQNEYGIMVYRYGGMNHTYSLNEGQEVTQELKDHFVQYINELYDNNLLAAETLEDYSVTITKDKFYTDTYIEGGNVEHTGTWGTSTTFKIVQTPTTQGSDLDLYDIQGIHYVYPYAWTMYATSRYSHGINRTNDADWIYSAVPSDIEIKLNESAAYSITLGYPFSVSFDFVWGGSVGTTMTARRRDHQHDVIFANKDGIIGKGENGEFVYQTYTQFFVPKGNSFSFLYNEVFWNSIIGNGQDSHKYGDEWIIITPDFEKKDENEEGNGVYVWEGRDYSPVFNGEYYLNSYPDLKATFGENVAAAFTHFTSNGMTEGRQASENFNVNVYKNRYEDLRNAFGENLILYYQHYIDYGIKEGRSGI